MAEVERGLSNLLADRPETNLDQLLRHAKEIAPLSSGGELHRAAQRVWSRAHGLGVISDFLDDDSITEVMVNGPGPVWVERAGEIEATGCVLGADDVALLVERILDPLGLRVDPASPMVDARLGDGSRVNIVTRPLALEGPVVTIRRFGRNLVGLDGFGDPELVDVLSQVIHDRMNVVVSGGTGTGKTTLLNALATLADERDRIVTIEDTAELRIDIPHVIRLEARPANAEGVGEVSIRDLVRNALRMRPDRMVVGEVRGGECLDMLMALNTGHHGCLTTVHANDQRSALDRLRVLAMMAAIDLPVPAVDALIGNGVDVIVQVERRGGHRFVSSVGAVSVETPLQLHPLWTAEQDK